MTSQHCKGNIKLAQESTHTFAIRLPVLIKKKLLETRFDRKLQIPLLILKELFIDYRSAADTDGKKEHSAIRLYQNTLRIHFNFISVRYSDKNTGFSYIVLDF